MKKIIFSLILVLLAVNAHAALTQVTGSTTNKDATRAQLNSAITEIDLIKSDKSCFASEAAFNTCFDLTWAAATVIASGFDGNLATTDDTLQEIAQKLDDLILGGSASISNTAYDATTWNGVADVAPSKDAVRDVLESLPTLTFSTGLTNTSGTITVTTNTYQPIDADLTDLADGSLSASKVGNGFYVADDCTTVTTPATGAICFEY